MLHETEFLSWPPPSSKTMHKIDQNIDNIVAFQNQSKQHVVQEIVEMHTQKLETASSIRFPIAFLEGEFGHEHTEPRNK